MCYIILKTQDTILNTYDDFLNYMMTNKYPTSKRTSLIGIHWKTNFNSMSSNIFPNTCKPVVNFFLTSCMKIACWVRVTADFVISCYVYIPYKCHHLMNFPQEVSYDIAVKSGLHLSDQFYLKFNDVCQNSVTFTLINLT